MEKLKGEEYIFTEHSDPNSSDMPGSSQMGTLALATDNFAFVMDAFSAAPIRPSKDGRLIARALRRVSNANLGQNIA